MNKVRDKERFGGIILALFGILMYIWQFDIAFSNRYFFMKATFLGPFMAVLGIALIFFPSYKTERIMRGEDVSHLKGARLITKLWWIIMAVAIVVATLSTLFVWSGNY